MAQRVEYGRPRKLNAFSGTLLALAIGGAYWMWRFSPAYLDAWTVDHVLRESATAIYRANHLAEPERSKALREILDQAQVDIRKQSDIKDPDLTITANILEDKAVLKAEYSVRITHPLIEKTTLLHFQREEGANLKRVDWDKQ
jgi:hypothetical protein